MKKLITYLAAYFTLSTAIQAQTVVPFLQKNGKYIWVDSATMKPIINNQEFDDADEMAHGFWCIGKKNSNNILEYALFNKVGKAITPFKFNSLDNRISSANFIEFSINEKYGIMDTTGKMITNAVYEQINISIGNDAMHQVKRNEKWGFVNSTTGKELIPCIYEDASGFSDGWALVSKGEHGGGYKVRYFIDKTGKTVLKPKFAKIEGLYPFSEGLAAIRIGINGPKGFIDKTGKMVIQPKFFDVYGFKNCIAQFDEGDDKFGFIDKAGKVIIPAKYSAIQYLPNDLFLVQENSNWGVINKKGEAVIPIQFEYLSTVSSNSLLAKRNGMFSIIDFKNKTLQTIKKQYEVVISYDIDLLAVSNNGKYGIINTNEQIIVPLKYGVYSLSGSKLIKARDENGRVTFFDKTGREYAQK